MASESVRRTSFALPGRPGREAPVYVGRERPVVRRPALERTRSEQSGFRESLPFIFFGAVCLILAVVLYSANPVPGNPIPLWSLLVAIGVIALVGGLIGALVRGDPTPSRPSWVRKRDVVPPPFASPPRPGRAAFNRAELRPVPVARRDPRPSPPRVGPGQLPPAETFPLPNLAPLAPTRVAPSPGPVAVPPVAEIGPADDVLRSIDEISSAIRRGRRAPKLAGGAVPPARTCGNCESSVPATEPERACRTCGTALCANCADTAAREGAVGLCPTCALLELGGEAAPTP